MAEIIFGDYRTVILCLLSMSVAFFTRDATVRKKVIAVVTYEMLVVFVFLWIFIVACIFTEFSYESMVSIFQWGIKWLVCFTVNISLQVAIYNFFWKDKTQMKILAIAISFIIFILPLFACV